VTNARTYNTRSSSVADRPRDCVCRSDLVMYIYLRVTQDHWKWHNSKVWVRFPIRIP